jgi:hypothetical protein
MSQDGGDHFLGRRFSGATRNPHDRACKASTVISGDSCHRPKRIVDHQTRSVTGRKIVYSVVPHQSRHSASGECVGHEAVTVESIAVDSQKNITRTKLPGVGRYTGQRPLTLARPPPLASCDRGEFAERPGHWSGLPQ